MVELFKQINLDTLISDPMLAVGTALLLLGPLLFLIALIKFITSREPLPDFNLPEADAPWEPGTPSYAAHPSAERRSPDRQPIEDEEPEPPVENAIRSVVSEASHAADAEKTIVMPAGMGEIQGQLEICFSQIKNLNKKVALLEDELERLSQAPDSAAEGAELMRNPANPGDFSQKLLKLAEHVIVLEKEVARMKGSPTSAAPESRPTTTSGSKPPIMPL